MKTFIMSLEGQVVSFVASSVSKKGMTMSTHGAASREYDSGVLLRAPETPASTKEAILKAAQALGIDIE